MSGTPLPDAWWVAVGTATYSMRGGIPLEQARTGVQVEPDRVNALSWPDFADEPPLGPPLILLPSVDGWGTDAARSAAAMHAIGRPIHVISTGAEGAEALPWLQDIPTTIAGAARGRSGRDRDRELLVSAGYLATLIGLERCVTASVDTIDEFSEDHDLSPLPTVVVAGSELTESQSQAAAAVRGRGGRVLLVARDGHVDFDNPWLANIDGATRSDHGAIRWREQGALQPRWRSVDQEAREAEARLAADQAARRDIEMAAGRAGAAREQRRLKLEQRQAAWRAAQDEKSRFLPKSTPTSVTASATADAEPVVAPTKPTPSAPVHRCAWCGQPVVFAPKSSIAECPSCRKRVTLGRCPQCAGIGISRIEGKRIVCTSCGYRSALPGAGQTLIQGGAGLARLGCALTALVWIGIPSLFILIVVVISIFLK